MKRFAGQAARHGGWLLHMLAQLALAVVVVGAMALAGAAWRLSRGPVALPWLVPMLQAAANADPALRISLGGAAIAWEGFRGGLDQPLDIRLIEVTLADPAGRLILTLPRAAVALAPGWLLLGRLVPRAIALDGARLRAERSADGALGLDLPAGPAPVGGGGLARLLRELAAPPAQGGSANTAARWSELRRLRLDDAALHVTDRQLGAGWDVSALHIDLRRAATGGISGTAAATLALGAVTTQLEAAATLDATAQHTALHLNLAPLVPAALARALPPTAPLAAGLAAVDAPVTLAAGAMLGPDLGLVGFSVTAELGAGTLHLGAGTVPVLAAAASVQGTPTQLTLTLTRLVTAARPDGPRSTLRGRVELARTDDAARVAARVTFDLDQVAFADLPALWPPGVGGAGVRPWITQNVTAGTAHDFHVELALTAPTDLSDATLTALSGGGDGSDVTVHWLRPVPPIEHAAVRLNLRGPDAIDLVVTAGREPVGADAILLRGGLVALTGLAAKDQFADISADLAGPLPAALALLDDKRIGLLRRSKLHVQDSAGDFSGRLSVGHLPLRADVNLDDLQIRTALKVTGARLAGLIAGHDLDQGMLDLTGDQDGLHVAGQATLAGIAADVQADLDFRAGPPDQVTESIAATGTVAAAQLAALGLDATGYASGSAKVATHLTLRRNASGEAQVAADLAGMALTLTALNWTKPRGAPAHAEITVALDHDRIAGLDPVQVVGEGVRLAGSLAFADGRPVLARLDHVELGGATDLRGTLHFPHAAGDPWRADLIGRSLDATAALARTKGNPQKQPAAGPPYDVDAHLDQVVLGPGRSLAAVVAHAGSDGQHLQTLDLSGQTAAAVPFRLAITPQPGGRRVVGSAADAGALLRALDVIPDMQGGRLVLDGSYDDTLPGHPLDGRAEIRDFRIRHAPALAKLLQAMTLYGLVDVMTGPGLYFSRLIAPFRLQDEMLTLHAARAFSPSLGLTAQGQLDLARQAFDMQGTIVPAYFFNTLLGDLPIIGRLFSPERGGGLFAATFSVRGPLEDPAVSVNPLAALTPGFLRGLFGLFDRPPPPP